MAAPDKLGELPQALVLTAEADCGSADVMYARGCTLRARLTYSAWCRCWRQAIRADLAQFAAVVGNRANQ